VDVKKRRTARKAKAGYTLAELMVAMSIFTVVMAAALTGFGMAARRTRAGTRQALYNQMARSAQQRLARLVEEGKTVALEGDDLIVTLVDFTTAAIRFEPGTNHPTRWEDNVLAYYADKDDASTRTVVVRRVSPIDGEAMFGIQASSPISAQISFHVGESAAEQAEAGGPGLSGVDVRMSSTPRNRQLWYD
jgi:prepilin-type N-terminal cleavage/methylation domain-containing protein